MKLPVIHQLFARRTIAGQLTLLRNIVIAGFMVLAFGYVLAIIIQGRTIALNADINEFRKTALEIDAGMLQARRNEKDFMLRNEESYVAEHDKTMARLNRDVDRAIATAPDAQLRDLVLQLQKDLRQYDANFKKMVVTQKTIGLDQNSGLHGTLREAVHKVEDEVVAQRQDALTISMLTMRRHEKDFIQRKDEEYVTQMAAEQSRFDSLLAKAKLPDYSKKAIAAQMSQYQAAFREYVAGIGQAAAAAEAMRNAVHLTEPVLDKLQSESAQRLTTADAQLKATLGVLNAIYGGLLLLILMLVAGGLYVASMSVLRPLERLTNTVKRLAEGDHTARSLINDKNEFGQLGSAFDNMMEERVATQQAIERENTQLNESVLNLLQAVAQLARKDLTIKVPVTEDVTGPVADALNLLTSETGKVLAEVTDISADVTSASLKVKEQTDTVSKVAATGRHEAEQTAESLAAAARSMGEIAGLAQECNTSAERAIRTTQEALQAVANTVGGINSARDTIRETEKRIKRLGERSQEISVAVNLINTIAERTHILALNASMHAASAGEAGRGFAVVADEVQRLAENARQATAQIAALVSNIQVETSDTVNTMNSAISQVVEGAKLAEQASERMHQTEAGTAELVALVRSIAADSRAQAQVSTELLERAAEIRKSTEETSRKIEEAGQYTGHLVEYARNLLGAVRVFKLPA